MPIIKSTKFSSAILSHMINENFVIFGALLNLIGSTGYVIDTVKGKTIPNRVTWFLWALAPLVAFTAEIQKGVGIAALMTFMVGFGPVMVFVASFVNKKAVWKISKLDIICGSLSVGGLILWSITKEGNLAIFFSILADLFAAVPTIIKSYKNPESESHRIFLFGLLSAGITLLTIKQWNFAHYAFPAYIFSICLLLFILIRYKIGKKIKLL